MIKSLAVALVFFSCWIAFQSIYSTAKNLHAELNFIRQKVAAIDFAKYDRVMTLMLRDQEREALAKDSPLYEWDYYRFSPTRMTYIIKYLAKQRGFTKVAVLLDFGDKVFFDQRTALVDFNELFAFSQKRWPSQTTKPLALITASSDSDRQIEISHVTDDFLLFEEVQGQTRKPFWPADFNDVPPPWFQIEFLKNHPKLIRGFAVGAVGPDLNFKPVDWRIQGSFDGNQWVDLDLQRVPLQKQGSGNYIVYMRKNFTPYNRYRFSLNKKDPSENMKVAGIHLDLGL